MSDIAILKEMIKKDAIVPLKERQEGKRLRYSVILTEPQYNYSVTIDGMPKDDEVIIINVDSFVVPRQVFNGEKGECRRADFVIITNNDTEKIILCIEMKKQKDLEKNIIQQLKGAQCFLPTAKKLAKRSGLNITSLMIINICLSVSDTSAFPKHKHALRKKLKFTIFQIGC